VFGYRHSYLPDYVAEKTGGAVRARDVLLFDPADTDETVLQRLRTLGGNACCAVSAATQAELDRFAGLALRAVSEGKRFLFRSAASLLTSLARLPPQPVAPDAMINFVPANRPGLVLVGSHVPLSSRQLAHLVSNRSLVHLEVDVNTIPARSVAAERAVTEGLADAHAAGNHVVISTSRTERQFDSPEERLAFGRELSALLMRIVARAPATLGFVVGKGGITSNDLLSTGLGLRSARVAGQIHHGCSVVLTPEHHRHGSIPVVIFPGNVGNEESLTLVFDRLTRS
jgi:uncharacterized protein YgbK (DUF1537 family)